MELQSLRMSKEEWGTNKGKVMGTIAFKGAVGTIELVLREEDCSAILRLCAARLVEQSKAIATSMTASIIENARMQIEDKSSEALQYNQ